MPNPSIAPWFDVREVLPPYEHRVVFVDEPPDGERRVCIGHRVPPNHFGPTGSLWFDTTIRDADGMSGHCWHVAYWVNVENILDALSDTRPDPDRLVTTAVGRTRPTIAKIIEASGGYDSGDPGDEDDFHTRLPRFGDLKGQLVLPVTIRRPLP